MGPDDYVCLCYRVSQRKIVNYILRERPRRASQISACLGAGTGCGWCVPTLRRMHQQLLSRGEFADGLSAAEYEAARRRYLARGRRHGEAAAP